LLRQAGIDVRRGVLAGACIALNPAFHSRYVIARPHFDRSMIGGLAARSRSRT
jgi:hypothetical protein